MSDLTYPEVGASRDETLPAGYQHITRRVRIGVGDEAYARLADGVMRWRIHELAGLRPVADADRAAVDATFVSRLGVGALRLSVPCRVVWATEQPTVTGYGFGTRRGHPETGEECFRVRRDRNGGVWFEVRAFSRPVSWYARLGGPVTTWLQQTVTDRYVAAARVLAGTFGKRA